MAVDNYLTTAPLNEVVRYRRDDDFTGDGVPFRGSVRTHPYDSAKFLLITSPGKDVSHFYEFRRADVLAVRDSNQIVTEDGDTVQIVELLVQKGSFGIEMKPFEVQ